MNKAKKVRKKALVMLYICAILLMVFDVLTYTKSVSGIVGDLLLNSDTGDHRDFVSASPTTGGTLPTGTPQYYVVVALNGSPTPTPLVKSSITKCNVGAGQNRCTIKLPCVVGTNNTYRVYYGTSTSAVADGTAAKYLSISAAALPTTNHDSDSGTSGTSVPSGSLYFSKFTGTGDEWSLGCRIGFGVAAPTAPVEINGNVRMNGTNTIKNSANPTANSDGATRYYVENSADLNRGCPGPTTAP